MSRVYLSHVLFALLCAAADAALVSAADETSAHEKAPPPVAFDSAHVQLVTKSGTLLLRVEVATAAEQRSVGLMNRNRLPENAGMLFVYPEAQPPEAGFWMRDTHIPLDIAFLDAHGYIVAIRTMNPCVSPYPKPCPTYSPGIEYWSALEVNRGFFKRKRVAVGDRVLLPDSLAPGRRN